MDVMTKGFYDCGQLDAQCMTLIDYQIHALNDYRLEQALESCVKIAEE